MTIPHLMNCPHNTEGWCLGCVAELGNAASAVVNGWQDNMTVIEEFNPLVGDLQRALAPKGDSGNESRTASRTHG